MQNYVVENLNIAKKKKGYTLKQLAEISGLSLGTVIKIMNGDLKKINPDKLQKLADALEVSAKYLTDGTTAGLTSDNYQGLVKIACISPEVRVGNCKFNAEQIVAHIQSAHKHNVKMALFPELCITGYNCQDLFFQDTLQRAAVEALCFITNTTAALDVLSIVGLPLKDAAGKLYNVAAVIYRGEILGVVPKVNLPNYNEFIEKRIFTEFTGETRYVTLNNKPVPFGSKLIFANSLYSEIKFAIEICEDVWAANSPSVYHSNAGANAIFNLSASNETVVKSDYRLKMIEIQSGMCGVIYAYCSAGPSESTAQTVFSAHNIICENGELLAESEPFADGYAECYADFNFVSNERAKLNHTAHGEDYTTVTYAQSIDELGKRVYSPTPFVPEDKKQREKVCERSLTILAYGLKKRIEHIHAEKLVLGVSGGSDSTLALLICARALKLLNRPVSDIIAVTMPCFGTSKRTLENSVALSNAVGATLKQIDITKSVTQHLSDIKHDLNNTNVTYENAQARERTQVLMDIANDVNGLVIGTGDMSEAALGWSTFNGDQMSMYAVNAAVPKTLVKAIIAYVADNSKTELKTVLRDILNTPVSPELLPLNEDDTIKQITEDSIGPYELHDYFLFMLIRKNFTPSKVYKSAQISFAGKYDDKTIYDCLKLFIKRFFTQEFKRSCAPDSVRLGSVDISKFGMRMPSDACYEQWLSDLEKVNPNK